VIIKPNLLAPAAPHTAVLTHSSIVRAAVAYVNARGARPSISDSPALGSFDRIMRDSGIKAALSGLSVDFREFKKSVPIDIGDPFGTIEIAQEALEADVIINLAKLKTHSQMLLTLGVKNMFGCVVGFRKAEWHMKTGVNREMFANLLVKIYHTVRPAVTIVDGILAMEGDGPGRGGSPIYMGTILAGTDACAVDRAVCRMLGIEPEDLLTNKVARNLGLADDVVTIDGSIPQVDHFTLPKSAPLIWGPRRAQGFIRRHLIQRPVVREGMCTLCGECRRICPAGAIRLDETNITFDYNRCVRCYCCIEVCPMGALKARETATGSLLRKFIHRNH
jgi:uncharacterized protein (DUF362 family)/Pyruvate/2-oxoacid:ferredoxin oxidoreductase delta subunit